MSKITYLEKGEKKPYRVTLRAVVTVEVDLDAMTKDEAESKAAGWDGGYPEGCNRIGDYWLGEDCLFDDDDMVWAIQNVEVTDIVDVLKLDHEDSDGVPESKEVNV